ncbi:hypothetical protein EDB86DRAFT_2082369 [Lactarius hatsudake]|nr:hypothetical protein EDB86DRAFT_2082369 [Lactarius hatsudake]
MSSVFNFSFGFPLHVSPSSASSPVKRVGHAALCRPPLPPSLFPYHTIPSTTIIKTRLTTSWALAQCSRYILFFCFLSHCLASPLKSSSPCHGRCVPPPPSPPLWHARPSRYTCCAALLPYRYRYCFTTRKHVAAAYTLHYAITTRPRKRPRRCVKSHCNINSTQWACPAMISCK